MPLIHSFNWPTVDHIIRSETATTMYKSLNGLVLDYLSNLLEKSSTRNVRKLRNTDTDLLLPLRKTNNGQRAISFDGPKLWSQLEPDAKQAPVLAILELLQVSLLIRSSHVSLSFPCSISSLPFVY